MPRETKTLAHPFVAALASLVLLPITACAGTDKACPAALVCASSQEEADSRNHASGCFNYQYDRRLKSGAIERLTPK